MDNEYVYLDLENIFNFISKDDDKEVEEREITDVYNFYPDEEYNNKEEGGASSKVIRELKNKGTLQRDNLRYDMVKMLLGEVFAAVEGEPLPFGYDIAFNTLKKYEMLKIKENE